MYFPMSYHGTHVDTAISTASSGGATYHFLDSFVCDGWGTVRLPTCTYNNALRIHEKCIITVSVGSLFTFSFATEQYSWYISGTRYPLVAMAFDTSGGARLVSHVAYYTNRTTGLAYQQVGAGSVSVYPNPANETLHVDAPGATAYEIFNNIGNTVDQGPLDGKSINIAALPAGIYFIKIVGDNDAVTRRFVKQ